MKISKLKISGPLIVETKLFPDNRGYFFEAFNIKKLSDTGITNNFVQDNVSVSKQGVLRGLHYQLQPKAQAKLINVLSGRILDIVVDIRRGVSAHAADLMPVMTFEEVQFNGSDYY